MEIGERKYMLCSKLGVWPSVFENNTHAGVCQKLYSFSEPCFDRPHNSRTQFAKLSLPSTVRIALLNIFSAPIRGLRTAEDSWQVNHSLFLHLCEILTFVMGFVVIAKTMIWGDTCGA